MHDHGKTRYNNFPKLQQNFQGRTISRNNNFKAGQFQNILHASSNLPVGILMESINVTLRNSAPTSQEHVP
eukprot:4723709-Ditylum_brightwellii.AAC.1